MANPIEIIATVALTDTQLRASPVPVSFSGGGGLTDAQLRAAAVAVSLAVNTPDIVDRAGRLLGHVVVDSMPAAGAGLTDTELRATAVAVSLASVPVHGVTGTFWQATQPVSGTFWQATQPVSGPLTDAQLRAVAVPISVASMPSTPVTGTFWQATQPVSIASMPSTPVTGTFWQATQPVSIAASVKAREDTAAMTWASVKSAAPAANALQATTGALAAGDYDFDINLMCSDTVAVGKGLVIEHRNAADGATLHNLGGCSPNGGADRIELRRYTIATNERIRVIAGTAAGAASSMYVSAIGRRTS